ncbi:hypothetical protein ACJJTC_013984 [Scirpophaga incertulas]
MFRYAGEMLRLPEKEVDRDFESYNCDMCNAGGWSSETELVIHRTSVHRIDLIRRSYRNSKQNPTCRLCLQRYKTSNDLLEHIKVDHLFSSPTAQRIEREIFVCDECSQIFFNKRILEFHIVQQHMRNRRVPCPVCPNKDLHRKAMWNHLEAHQLRSVSTCPICLRKFKSVSQLKQHIDTHNRYYFCDPCGLRTHREEIFNEHIMQYKSRNISWHTEINCRKVFVFPSPKKTHFIRNVLKGIVMLNLIYICSLCRELCTSRNAMIKHIKRVHMTVVIKPETKHICKCGEEFEKGVFLKLHMLKSEHNNPSPTETVRMNSSDDEDLAIAELAKRKHAMVEVTSDPFVNEDPPDEERKAADKVSAD